MPEIPRPGPEEERAKPEWGTEECQDYWGEELDELAEDGLPQELEDLEEGGFVSIESMMRTLDPPDERRVSELSREEKELLLRLVSEWRDLPIGVSVITRKEGKELIVPEGEEVNPEDLIDIRFKKLAEEEIRGRQKEAEVPRETVTKHLQFRDECGFCGRLIEVEGVVTYERGTLNMGQLTIGDQTFEISAPYSEEEEKDFDWTVEYPCTCISDVTKTLRAVYLTGKETNQ